MFKTSLRGVPLAKLPRVIHYLSDFTLYCLFPKPPGQMLAWILSWDCQGLKGEKTQSLCLWKGSPRWPILWPVPKPMMLYKWLTCISRRWWGCMGYQGPLCQIGMPSSLVISDLPYRRRGEQRLSLAQPVVLKLRARLKLPTGLWEPS